MVIPGDNAIGSSISELEVSSSQLIKKTEENKTPKNTLLLKFKNFIAIYLN
jgi:hypothetical protein